MVSKRLVQVPLHITEKQRDALRELSTRNRVPQQVYLREALDDLLKKYMKEVRS